MKPVKIKFKSKFKIEMTPEIFFKNMPYMLTAFDMVLEKRNPDVIIYTGKPLKPGKYQRVWFTHENVRPPKNLKTCDWALSVDYNTNIRHLRFPNYVRLGAGTNLLHKKINPHNVLKSKKKFCAFVYAHDVPFRNAMFDALSKYKKVDAPGRCRNNMAIIGNYKNAQASRTSPIFNEEKLEFIKQYKFVIAFEHSSHPGYVSEKIYHPLLVNSVPVYWGNPLIKRDFNVHRFINAHKLGKVSKKTMLDYLVTQVIKLDKNDELYMKTIKCPCYPNDTLTPYVNPSKIINFFSRVFNREAYK